MRYYFGKVNLIRRNIFNSPDRVIKKLRSLKKKKLTEEERIQAYIKEYGKMSVPFLMYKFKYDYNKAKDVCEKYKVENEN